MPISQYKAQSGHCISEDVSQCSKISVLPISVIKSFDSFTEWIDLLSFGEVLWQVPIRVFLELLNQSFDCIFAITIPAKIITDVNI